VLVQLAVGFGVGFLCRPQLLLLHFSCAFLGFLLQPGVSLHQFLLFPGVFRGFALIFRHTHLLSVHRERVRSAPSHQQHKCKKAFPHRSLLSDRDQVYTRTRTLPLDA
jgi:hypothetical protein